MPSWLRSKSYDRKRSLAQAARAKSRGNATKAIARYREVLAHDPRDVDVHRRIAPLLAKKKQPDEAWRSYQVAIRSLRRAGFVERAVGVLREAAGTLSRRRCVWEELAAVECERGRPVDALHALIEGRRQFRRRGDVGDAIHLLIAARKLDPHHFEANFDLAGLLAQVGARDQSARILRELAARAHRGHLRRVRRRQLRLSPSPATFWRWMRSWVGVR